MKVNQYYNVPIEREFDCRQCGTHVVVTTSKDKRVVFCSSVCEKNIGDGKVNKMHFIEKEGVRKI